MRFLFVFLVILATVPLAHSQAHSIDFTATIIGLDGHPIATGGANTQPMTLGDICVNAIEAQTSTDQQMTGLEKFNLAQLAQKIYHNKHAVLSAEEVSKIKDRVGKVYGPAVVGPAWMMLDPSLKQP